MNTILPEFMGSMARIRNNFYFSFLALNFVNQRPFTHDIILPVAMSQNIMTSGSLNSFDKDGVQEHGNSIRRHFLNDMVIAYERYSMLMIASHNNSQHRIDPALVNDRRLGAHLFEQLTNVYQPDEVTFLIQLRRFRNSIVHYNGVYSATNELDYTFGTQSYHSVVTESKIFRLSLILSYGYMINSCRQSKVAMPVISRIIRSHDQALALKPRAPNIG